MSALGVLGVSPGGSGVSFLGLWVSVSAPVVDPLKVRPGALEKGSLWELPRLLSGAPWLVIDRPWGTARIDAMEAGCRAGPGAPRQGHQAGTVQVPWLGDPEGSEVDRPLHVWDQRGQQGDLPAPYVLSHSRGMAGTHQDLSSSPTCQSHH